MEANSAARAATADDHAGYTVTWENVNCKLKSGGIFSKPKVVHSLIDNTGFARPGESLAIIGPSGAGKTTLLDILSQRKSLGEITGEVLVNGTKPDVFFKRRLGQITTMMAHIPTMTVRETLMFAAECRMPRNSTHEERVARVDEVIAGLKLTNAQNTPVGDELIRGVSSGEKKRTEVATEMIARPRMLFLDEPTSGLDDFGARFTMELVLKYVKSENVCVVIVIHQPSEAVFNLFDNTMLLSEGRTCYFGPVAAAEPYFSTMGYPTPKLQNPIEHYLDVISANTQAAATYYEKSPLAGANLAELNRLKSQTYSAVRYSEHIVERQWWDLMRLLGWRCLMRYWRNPSTSWGRLFLFLVLALFMGGIFYGISPVDLGTLRQITTTYTFFSIFVAIASVPQFLEDRELYLQEMDGAFYTTPPFWLTYLVLEGCFVTVITTIIMVIIFYMANPWLSYAFGRIYPMMFLQFWLATAVAQAWSAWSKTLVQAYTALWAAGLIFWIFCGVQAPLDTMSPGLRWIADVNYWRWCLMYVCWQIFYDLKVPCGPLPSAGISEAVASGFAHAQNASFVADKANAVAVTTFWAGIDIVNANTETAKLQSITPATQAALAANSLAIQNRLAPASTTPGNFTTPGQTSLVLGGYSVYDAGTTASQTAARQPDIFPAGSYCPIGQGADFITYINGVKPNDIATTNVSYAVNAALFVFFAFMGLTGLMFSRNYRKR
ncbi:hypothetical protein DFJ74DRAFT_766323 [Hyaloraphidium curvatum]|nr:hypothetical protein DFJ74DRAFT_766323 [Hyaloraphidium curvatum]